MNSILIYNATVVTPTEVLTNASVMVERGIITQVVQGLADSAGEFAIDAQGAIVMPGIIDIHTDALDAEIIPRPGADIPIKIAFRELERKMSGCGFTTVYHSLHLGYDTAELHSRSKYTRDEVFETVHQAATGSTLLNNKIHLRFELTGVHSYEKVFQLIDKGYIDMLSVMDHTPGQGQISKEEALRFFKKLGKTEAEALVAIDERLNAPIIKGQQLEQLIAYAKARHISVASHDDDSIAKVDYMLGLGVNICEFPINMETALHAAKAGMHVVGGASNILRGGSLSGNLNMKDAVLNGSVDSLCSDYYPPAILHSVFKLHQEAGMPLPAAANMASLNPAKAVGIDAQTGSIETGKDADIIIIELIDGIPMVTHTLVKGQIVAQAHNKQRVAVEEHNYLSFTK